jgi:hypothetical protein
MPTSDSNNSMKILLFAVTAHTRALNACTKHFLTNILAVKNILESRDNAPATPNPFAQSRPVEGSTDRLRNLYKESYRGKTRMRQHAIRNQTEQELSDSNMTSSYMQQMPRRWKPGDVYAPRDLSPYEANKWRGGSQGVKRDILDMLGLNPLDNYRVCDSSFLPLPDSIG